MAVLDIVENLKVEHKKMNFPINIKVSPMDKSQEAVLNSLKKHNLVICQSAGGCGKTATAVNVAAHYVALGKRVLIVSKTEKALSVIADRLNALGTKNAICMTSGKKEQNVMFANYLLNIVEKKVNLDDSNGSNLLKYLFKRNEKEAVKMLDSEHIKRLKNILADSEKRRNLITLAKMSLVNKKNKKDKIMQEIDFSVLFDVFPLWCVSAERLNDVLPLIKDSFQLVIFDELTQMSPAETIGGLFRASQCVGFADSQQLRHICFLDKKKEKSLMIKHDVPEHLQLHWSYRSNSGLDFLMYYAEDNLLLTENYRTPENAFKFLNQEYYNNSIHCHKPAVKGAIKKIFVENSKTIEGNVNPTECKKALEIIKDLIKENKSKDENKSIAVITPFVRQATLMREMISNEISYNDIEKYNITALNTHQYQGGEADNVIFLSTYASNSPYQMLNFLESRSVFCVGISRSKERMYVLYNTKQLKDGLFKRYLASIEE